MLTFVSWAIYQVEPGLGLLGIAAAEILAVSYVMAIAIERWLVKAN